MSINRTTANFNLRVPNYDEPQWHVPVDDNWDILDATLGLFVRVSNIRGPWKNATAYIVGDRVVDTVTGLLYETATAHTSASTGTFAEARAASPSLWTRIDQFDADPSAPSFTIEESDDQVPSVNGSIVNALDSTLFGPTNAGWVGKGLYTRRTNETQALYDARIADPENVTEATVYRYIGPEGFRVAQQRTTGFTLTQSNAGHLILINAATTQNVTFPAGVLRDNQKSHVSDIYPHMWGDLYINPASQDVTLVLGTGVTAVWSNGQSDNVIPKGVVVRWHYLYLTSSTVSVYLDVGTLIDEDTLVTASRKLPPSQGSVKAYIDTNVANLEAAIDAIAVGVTQNSSWRTPTVTSNEMTLSATLDTAIADDGAGAIVARYVRLINDTPANALTVFLPNNATAAQTAFYCYVPTTQTGEVTLKVQAGAGGTGTINGIAGGTGRLAPKGGSFFLVVCESNAGDEPVYRADIQDYYDTINFVIDGGGSTITTGVKGDVQVDFDCTILGATALADQSGSIVVDIWNDTYANFPPTDADSITASAPVTISTATKSTDSTLTGWTTTISAGDILRYNVDSVTSIERATIALKVLR